MFDKWQPNNCIPVLKSKPKFKTGWLYFGDGFYFQRCRGPSCLIIWATSFYKLINWVYFSSNMGGAPYECRHHV